MFEYLAFWKFYISVTSASRCSELLVVRLEVLTMQVDDLIERRKVKTASGVSIEVVTEEVHGEAKIVLSGPFNSAHIVSEDITAAQACPFM